MTEIVSSNIRYIAAIYRITVAAMGKFTIAGARRDVMGRMTVARG